MRRRTASSYSNTAVQTKNMMNGFTFDAGHKIHEASRVVKAKIVIIYLQELGTKK
jgi:hypothetical protein